MVYKGLERRKFDGVWFRWDDSFTDKRKAEQARDRRSGRYFGRVVKIGSKHHLFVRNKKLRKK